MDTKEDCSRHYELHLHHKSNTMSSTSSLVPPPLNFCSSLDRETASPSPSLNAMCAPGYPGVLSLHHYRRYLSNTPPVDSEEIKKLRRKNAAFNLNQPQMQMHTCHHPSQHHHSHCPCSVSSVASSPPPLSPSYSPSAWSEQGPESLDGFLLPGSPSPLDPTAEQTYYPYPYGYRPTSPKENAGPQKAFDTFRDRLGKYPEEPDLDEEDTCLVHPSSTPPPITTIVHHGVSFEILNPRESLRFARVVSYIDDIDSYRGPDATPTPTYHDSAPTSLRTQSIAEEEETLETEVEEDSKAHRDLVGDSPHQPMPSISERLEENEFEYFATDDYDDRPDTAPSQESEIGEPGSPIEHHPSHAWEDYPGLSYDYNNGYGWDYGLGNRSGLDGLNSNSNIGPVQPTEMRIHRRLSRRSIARRQKKTSPFRKLCSALRRKRLFTS